ncbi:MAG: hypothetical protein QM658_03105 [Gordonia sp. (in: high G+C Gram-positive bacteria)]
MSEVTVQVQQPMRDFADGEVVTLERTAFVDKLLAAGRVVLVDDAAAEQAASARAELGVPDRTAPRAAWVEFLSRHGVTSASKQTRDDLIVVWGAHDCAEHDDAAVPR